MDVGLQMLCSDGTVGEMMAVDRQFLNVMRSDGFLGEMLRIDAFFSQMHSVDLFLPDMAGRDGVFAYGLFVTLPGAKWSAMISPLAKCFPII